MVLLFKNFRGPGHYLYVSSSIYVGELWSLPRFLFSSLPSLLFYVHIYITPIREPSMPSTTRYCQYSMSSFPFYFILIHYISQQSMHPGWFLRQHIIGHHYHYHICPLSFPSLAIVIHIVPVSLGSGMDRGDRWRDLSHHEDVTPARPTPGAKTKFWTVSHP